MTVQILSLLSSSKFIVKNVYIVIPDLIWYPFNSLQHL